MRHPFAAATILGAALLAPCAAGAAMTPRQIYQAMAPGVVFISAQEPGADTSSCGTGSIVSAAGEVLTNAHVILDKATGQPYAEVRVSLKPAQITGDLSHDLADSYVARVVAFDKAMDLALLRMKQPPRTLTVLTLGDSDQLAPGDQTVAIGHPEQGGLWTLTTGVLSDQIHNEGGVQGRDAWQMETSLNRGNSGGPLFDSRGYVIGVNTAIARKASDGLAITGINFAIKSRSARAWLDGQGMALAFGAGELDTDAPPEALAALVQPGAPAAAPRPGAADAAGTALAPAPASPPAALASASGTGSTPAPATHPDPGAAQTPGSQAIATAVPAPATPAPVAPTPAAPAAPSPATATATVAAPALVHPKSGPAKRPPVHFVLDLDQSVHPYKPEQVSSFFEGLKDRRKAALDELDQETGGK